jgi:hypothetical protein
MEWPLSASEHDAMIVRDETSPSRRFVVHGRRGPQIACQTYGEAEVRALSYARQASSRVWYADARGFQLIDSFVRVPVSSPTIAKSE